MKIKRKEKKATEPKYKKGDKIKVYDDQVTIESHEVKKFSFVGHEVEVIYYNVEKDGKKLKHAIPEDNIGKKKSGVKRVMETKHVTKEFKHNSEFVK